jgi:hypothetical protein
MATENKENAMTQNNEQDDRVKECQAEIMRQMDAFRVAGNQPVTEDDVRFAVYLQGEIDFKQAMLHALHKGIITIELPDPEDIETALVKTGKSGVEAQ